MKLYLLLLTLFLSSLHVEAQSIVPTAFIEAPVNIEILKESFNRRVKFSDIIAEGKFLFLKIEFRNLDKKEHYVGFPCFCVVDNQGYEYEVHTDATLERQTRYEDFKRGEAYRFNRQILRPQMKAEGWLVFDVPDEGTYQLKFRGFLKANNIVNGNYTE